MAAGPFSGIAMFEDTMKKSILTLLFTILTSAGFALTPMAAPEHDPNADKGLTIDNWNPKPVTKIDAIPPAPAAQAKPVAPAAKVSVPVVPAPVAEKVEATPVQEPVETPATAPARVRVPMNEMTGTLSSVDEYDLTLRIAVDGGINPEFSYDKQTVIIVRGKQAGTSDLTHGDKVTVRYIGKDLLAREIEKLN